MTEIEAAKDGDRLTLINSSIDGQLNRAGTQTHVKHNYFYFVHALELLKTAYAPPEGAPPSLGAIGQDYYNAQLGTFKA